MAAYVKISYNVSSTTNPTYVARYTPWPGTSTHEDWIDHVTYGSISGTPITIEPWAPPGTTQDFYAYQFPTTGLQDLYFFSKNDTIPDEAFINCEPIVAVDCSQPDNDITTLGKSVFSLCYNLSGASLSDNITEIGRNAFEQDSAMTVCNIPESLSAIPSSMFASCYSLQHVRIPDSVQRIQSSAFAYCRGLEDVYLGSGLTFFEVFVFGGCSGLTSITATSKNVPITYYTSTFQGVHTGGTLYYPAGYESEYGPESGMLSTEEYLLGYYDWNGIPTGTTPTDRWAYLDPSGKTISSNVRGSYTFYVRGSGCSIDSSYTPTFTFSGDTSWINSISSVTFISSGRWRVVYYSPRNLGDSDREVYITVNGVHDTDGNVYNDLVYHATQGWAAYTFLNYDSSSASSAASVDTIEVVPVNTTICSVSVASSGSSTPDLWTGVAQPTVTVLGNYITVNWPENPYDTDRNYQLNIYVVYGDNCSQTTTPTLYYSKNQNAAATPAQKDIEAADADYSVGSGTGNASTTVQASACTYDHFTYITGGSFSVTATSGPDNTIVFTYPENPTTTARTGYVYITFYDSDGNTYGPQTITFTQQAGSSPGPGPGPDPETGYVLTSLTISDQEQHRYFVEARPGVVYSAAGQYYRTISACEARYSLYYVNSYGGVDVLPFKEKGWKKSDTITRFNYSRSFRNNTPEFENVNYMNEVKASWELHTGWLSDEQSRRMHELVESTIVYLYDAEEKTYTPVVMTDKKLEYKTYHNQGKKFYNYTINVEESQSKERR